MKAAGYLDERISRLRKALARSGLIGVAMVPGPNIRYFTGIDSILVERPFMLFVPADGEPQLLAPEFEAEPYRESGLVKVHAWTDSAGPRKAMRDVRVSLGRKGAWGVEGRVPFRYLEVLRKEVDWDYREGDPVLEGLRRVKDSREVGLLKRAAEILSRSFMEAPSLLEEDMTEEELARKMSDVIYSKGATRVAELLVQSGPRTAIPHGLPTSRRIRRGEAVVLDLVMAYEGYHADVTRTLCLGPSRALESVYGSVLEAQATAISAVSEGVTAGSVDSAARRLLVNRGLGKFFTHRTGHGLGLEVHEAPYIVGGSTEKLRRGEFFTVEPGAYMAGKFGVRIEDNVTPNGGRALVTTTAPKDYGWWN